MRPTEPRGTSVIFKKHILVIGDAQGVIGQHERAARGFRQIMVFCFHPKNGHRADSAPFQFVCDLNRGKGFVDRIDAGR